jgi:hypothetical protein
MKFEYYLIGQEIDYEIPKGYEKTKMKCPIDGTSLLYFDVSQVRDGYYCPNCDSILDDVSSDSLDKFKDKFLKEKEDKLIEIESEKSELLIILDKYGNR